MADLIITLTRSPIGYNYEQKRTAKALGLTRLNKTVVRPDNDCVRGMIRRIQHLVAVQCAESEKDEA